MYVVYKMENIDQVKKELREELRAEMRQLRDELLHNLPLEEEATREVEEITKDARVLTEQPFKKNSRR
jgi:hypothetical protein